MFLHVLGNGQMIICFSDPPIKQAPCRPQKKTAEVIYFPPTNLVWVVGTGGGTGACLDSHYILIIWSLGTTHALINYQAVNTISSSFRLIEVHWHTFPCNTFLTFTPFDHWVHLVHMLTAKHAWWTLDTHMYNNWGKIKDYILQCFKTCFISIISNAVQAH